VLYAFAQYFLASRQVMAMTGGREVLSKSDNPRLWNTVENLAIATGMPMPRVFVIHDSSPNAFATGRDPDHAIVAATTGLLDILDDAELEGVMAHELGHVRNYDIRLSMVVFGLVVAVGFIADMLIRLTIFGRNSNGNWITLIIGIAAALVAPLVATMVQLAVSRQREYLADASAALITRHPDALASALTKITGYSSPMQRQNASTAHLWISDPQKKRSWGLGKLLATHPPTEERVARLTKIGQVF
jgi:heat shock protein HtpX